MKIGVIYPQTELRGDPMAVHRIGLAAEELGLIISLPMITFSAPHTTVNRSSMGPIRINTRFTIHSSCLLIWRP